MKKYSLVNRLLSESLAYQYGDYGEEYTITHAPVDSFSQIFGNHEENSNRLRRWSTMDRGFDRYWEDILGDPHQHLYWSVDKFFRNNPKAAADVKERLGSSVAKRGSKIKSAIPIFYDNDVGGDPWGYMYNGQISPAGRLNSAQLFVKILETGGHAEKEFAEYLKQFEFGEIKVVGGSRNPDVVADGEEYEVGAGLDKVLWLGKQFPTRAMSPRVAKRRKVLNQFYGTESLSKMPFAEKRFILALWKSTGYDFLIMGRVGSFKAYSLSDQPTFIGKQQIRSLTEDDCFKSRIRIEDGGHVIDYNSIDWSKATPLK